MPRFRGRARKKFRANPYPPQSYDPYLGFSGVNKQVRIRPSVYVLNAIRKYNKGEQLKIKKFALHELVASLIPIMLTVPYRIAQEAYRSIENYILFFLQREAFSAQAYGARASVLPKDMLMTRSIGSDFY